METHHIERENGALGGLFHQIIHDMKVGNSSCSDIRSNSAHKHLNIVWMQKEKIKWIFHWNSIENIELKFLQRCLRMKMVPMFNEYFISSSYRINEYVCKRNSLYSFFISIAVDSLWNNNWPSYFAHLDNFRCNVVNILEVVSIQFQLSIQNENTTTYMYSDYIKRVYFLLDNYDLLIFSVEFFMICDKFTKRTFGYYI